MECTGAWDVAITHFSALFGFTGQRHCKCCYREENFWWIWEGYTETGVWYSSGFLHCSTLHCCFFRRDWTLQFVSCSVKKLYTERYSFISSTSSDLKPQNCLVLLRLNCKLFPAPLTMWQLSVSTAKMWSFFLSRHFFPLLPLSQPKQTETSLGLWH